MIKLNQGGEGLKKAGIFTAIFGLIANFSLFLIKLYVGIGSSSLAIYCDAINNLGDSVGCVIALVGFAIALKLSEHKGKRIEALCTFVIGLILAITGAYFAYNGVGRMMYPVQIAYLKKYALLILLTIIVKLVMALVYMLVNKKHKSPVFKALIMDSLLDTGITLCAFLSLTLSVKINFAIDSIISIIIGVVITISAVKTIINQGSFLVNE